MTEAQLQAELAEATALYLEQSPGIGKPAGPRRMEARDRMLAAQTALRDMGVAGVGE